MGLNGVFTMVGTGKFFVGGNWKCNGTKDSISKLVIELNEDDVDIVISPPFVYIDQVKSSLTEDNVDKPIWAIGTGKVASLHQDEVHVAVREWLSKNIYAEVASN